MSDPAEQLASDRVTRQAARGVFDARVAQIRADLAARGIGGRIADQARGEVEGALAEGLAVARESKGIIAATLGALLAWAFRKPILHALQRLAGKIRGADDQAAVQADSVMEEPQLSVVQDDFE